MSVYSGGVETLMPILAPLIPAGITVVKVAVAGGFAYFAGRELIAVVDEEADEKAEEIEQELLDKGADLISEGLQGLEESLLYVIKNLGKAVIEGVEITITALRQAFEGKEVGAIMTLTIILVVIVAIFTLRHELLTGPAGAGEYMAMNRPSPGDGFLGP